MTDNVIYGIDFRAGKEEAPLCNAPDVLGAPSSQVIGNHFSLTIQGCRYWTDSADTAPSGYCAPSDDCA